MSLTRVPEQLVIYSRWILAPMLVGLGLALALLAVAFFCRLGHLVTRVVVANDAELLVALLGLIDLVLVGSLIVVVIYSGYENFVEKIDRTGLTNCPDWISTVSFSRLKQKLLTSMIAISSVTLLKALVNLEINVTQIQVKWLVVANLIFILAYAVLAVTDAVLARYKPSDD